MNLVGIAKSLLIPLLLLGFVLPLQVNAQDLEPRRWSHLPSGQNILGVGYVYTEANVFFSPALNITDGISRINSLGITAIRTFELAGKSARVSLLLPYTSGRWEGNVDDEYQVVHRKGIADPRLRLSVNLYGSPALQGFEYQRYRAEHTTNTVVGASLALKVPMGKYCNECLINIGSNRWVLRPQIGVVHTRGPWSFELTSSVIMFTDNDDFIDRTVLKQKPVYTMQTHLVYAFQRGIWASLSAGYGTGGRIRIDQQKTTFEVDNWVWAAGLGMPIGKYQGLKLAWLSGRTQKPAGRDSDNLVLSWSVRWGK